MLSGSRDIRLYDSNNNLSGYSAPGAGEDHYRSKVFDFADPKKKHLLRYENSPMRVQDVYEYDDYGNMTAHKRQDTAPTTAIRSTTAYSTDGNRMLSQTDPRGLTMSYEYNSNGTVKKATMPNGQAVSYEYDALKRVTDTQSTTENGTYKNQYTYENDRLKTVSHNTTGTEQDVVYTFEYDAFGKPTTVKVGTQELSTNVYDTDRQQKLRKVIYGNGQYSENNYDEFGRLIATRSGIMPETTETSETEAETTTPTTWDYEYSHAANGQVAKMKDNVLGRVVWTEFDEANRPKKSITQDMQTGELIYRTTLSYDEQEHVSSLKEEVADTTYTTTYKYDWDDRPIEVRYGSSTQRVKYTYDGQGRLSTRRIINGSADQTATFSYLASSVPIPNLDTVSSTNLVSSISQPGVSFSYAYASDSDNIVSETRTGGSYAGTTTYEYDGIGQLKRVNSPSENATWVYTYDLGGNILSKKKYAYTTGALGAVLQTIPYTYSEKWKDQLATYNGQALEHDEIGNLLNDGTWTYTWTRGRQLAGMSKLDGSVSISYEYNAAGLRTKKIVNNVATEYTLNGKQVVHLTRGDDHMHFYYDAQGRPSIVNYNSAMYHYLYNLQGDVIGLIDTSGNIVVEYNYDAWGKLLAMTGSLSNTLGHLNPFRYRAYVYDEETRLYYLKNRYYNSEWKRFINSDILLGRIGRLLEHNLFAYCSNNVVTFVDNTGCSKTYVFYYYFPESNSPLKAEAENSPYYNASDTASVEMIAVASSDDFIKAWNSIEGEIGDVYLYLHGGVGYFQMAHDTIYATIPEGSTISDAYSISLLEPKTINGSIYNFACHGADESTGLSVSKALAQNMNVPVYGCDVGVSYRYSNPWHIIRYGESWYARTETSASSGTHWYKYCVDPAINKVMRQPLAEMYRFKLN